jgi:hypothetical protein
MIPCSWLTKIFGDGTCRWLHNGEIGAAPKEAKTNPRQLQEN